MLSYTHKIFYVSGQMIHYLSFFLFQISQSFILMACLLKCKMQATFRDYDRFNLDHPIED